MEVERAPIDDSRYKQEDYGVYRPEIQDGYNSEMMWSDNEDYDLGPESEEEMTDEEGEEYEYDTAVQGTVNEKRLEEEEERSADRRVNWKMKECVSQIR